MRRAALVASCIIGIAVHASVGLASIGLDGCPTTVSIGVDTSLATTSVAMFLGRAAGQTFVAEDTLIRSVRVWRVGEEGVGYLYGLDLYIVTTDSTGLPDVADVVARGPTVTHPEHYGHPSEFSGVFDPPVALPRSGLYALFVQIPVEQCPGVIDLLARDSSDAYGLGHLWLTHRSNFSGCVLFPFPQGFVGADLIFDLETCRDVITRTRGSTWGRVKILYR